MKIDPETSALIVVDIQHDFLPGGSLAVGDGDEILEPLAALVEHGPFRELVATQDWHPEDHVSFASNHEGREPFETIDLYGHDQTLWPDHCIAGTHGARLHPAVPLDAATAVVRKATEATVDSYSAFRNNWNEDGERPRTGLAGYLRDRGIESVWLCGLARDYCVKWSAEDAVADGFETRILWNLTRSIDPGDDDELRGALEDLGVVILDSPEILEAG